MKKTFTTFLLFALCCTYVFANTSSQDEPQWFVFTNSSWEQLIISSTSDLVVIKNVTDKEELISNSQLVNSGVNLSWTQNDINYLSWLVNLTEVIETKINNLLPTLSQKDLSEVINTLKSIDNNIWSLKNQYVILLKKLFVKKNKTKLIEKSEQIIYVLSKYLKDNKKISQNNIQTLNGIISYTKFRLIELKTLTNQELFDLIVN